jgi:hypothetical protein
MNYRSPPGLATLPPARLLHGLPGFDGVVAEHPANDWLTNTEPTTTLLKPTQNPVKTGILLALLLLGCTPAKNEPVITDGEPQEPGSSIPCQTVFRYSDDAKTLIDYSFERVAKEDDSPAPFIRIKPPDRFEIVKYISKSIVLDGSDAIGYVVHTTSGICHY